MTYHDDSLNRYLKVMMTQVVNRRPVFVEVTVLES